MPWGSERGGRISKVEYGMTLRSQTRLLVKRLHHYFMKEKNNYGMLIPVKQVQQRVSDALQISKFSISRILKENVEESGTPGKKRPHPSPKSALDSFNEAAIRNHIYQYYFKKEIPTRDKLISSLRKAELFTGSSHTLSMVLKKLGFKWKLIKHRKLLMERYEIVTWRCEFLRKIQSRDFNKLICLGETCINTGHTVHKSLNEDSVKSSKKEPTGLILIHAGGVEGFVPGTLSLTRLNKPADYDLEMNATTFRTWFQNLLNNIPPGSTIVMGYAPYHLEQINKTPTSKSTRIEIVNWLTDKNIDFDISLNKAELLAIVKNKKGPKTYTLDKLAEEKGHEVLRLPPYHNQFNPIELIWAQIKGEVAKENKTFTITEVERLTREAIARVTVENWKEAIFNTRNVIKDVWKMEGILEDRVDGMISLFRSSDISESSDEVGSEVDCTETEAQPSGIDECIFPFSGLE